MNTIMIHEMWKDMYIPEDCTLTFDDGLVSQYKYGRTLPNKKIFFISTGIICHQNQSQEYITCEEAHRSAFDGNYENYMTVAQLKNLLNNGIEIGGHSHSHQDLFKLPTLGDKVKHIKEDNEQMMEWFKINLNYTPTAFAFPYNYDLNGIYKEMLKKYGFTNFYGEERITLDEISV